MPEPLEPNDIARRTFHVARRGYEQQAVRGFLHEVSALIDRLRRSEQELRDRAERAEAKLGANKQPDEAMLLEVLGEETTRVLTSARDAAGEIRAKAEAAAERIIAGATAEAAEIRSNAVRDADALMEEAKAETDSTLEAARTELERRSAEAAEAAARIRADGEAAAQAIREDAQAELARARAEGEAALAAARDEGRAMVAEAQAVRERVLRDLAVRRKRARQQVEKLNAGRERLLEAYEVVRRTVGEATDELSTALSDARLAADAAARRVDEEPEPTLEQLDEEVANAGLVDLPIAELLREHEEDTPGPFSGEVPAVTAALDMPPSDAPPAADPTPDRPVGLDERRGRKRRRKGFEGLPPGELTIVQPTDEGEGVRILADPATVEEEEEPAAPDAQHTSAGPEIVEVPPEAAGAADAPAADGEVDEVPPAAPTVEIAEEETAAEPVASDATTTDVEETVEADAAVEPEADGSAADEVFARLRAEQGDDDATTEIEADDAATAIVGSDDAAQEGDEGDDGEPVVVDAVTRPFAARRAALASVEKELERRLKRGLADEQNEVLDLLRRAKPKGVDDLLPGIDEHASAWTERVTASLTEAAAAGADWSGGTPTSVTDLADELARGLTLPLRERIDRGFAASDGNLDDVSDRVRALYREWKGQRLAETSAHFVAAAYARGVFDGLGAGTSVRWVVDPSTAPCPDCDDNVLAGSITKGAEFPTGNARAPAHPGCHCLVLAAED